jgi:hypothetical protein
MIRAIEVTARELFDLCLAYGNTEELACLQVRVMQLLGGTVILNGVRYRLATEKEQAPPPRASQGHLS